MRTQTRVYKLQLNEEQKQLFIELCGYRRWAWNHALDIWNDMYEVRR
ncbi:helix-turn-helix domain-containing protein, partial [Lactobacillus sp. 23-2]